MKMADSNKGWHPEWFYVANPPPALPAFSGRFAEKRREWSWGPSADERKTWTTPMLDFLGPLKAAGLTGVKVMWTFFERRIQPLMAWAHALYRYAGVKDPTRMSPEELTQKEVRARVWAVIKRPDDNPDLDRHERGQAPYPTARHAKNDLATLLRAKAHYPPLPEDDDRRAANRAENEHQRELSQQRKKHKAEKAVRHMRRAQKGPPSEELEKEDDDEDEDGEVTGDGEDDDDDDDDDDGMGARYAKALGLGKRSAGEAAEDPSAKRFHADPGQKGIPRGSEAAPVVEENLLPSPEILPPPPAVSQAPSSGVPALPSEHVGAKPSAGGDPWGLQWVSRTSRAPRRASSTAAMRSGGPADTAGMEPAATQRAVAAGLDEAPSAEAASQVVAKAAEPPSRPAMESTKVVDPTGAASEEEGAAAGQDAATDEEDVSRVGVLEATAATSVTPTAAASVGMSSTPAHAKATEERSGTVLFRLQPRLEEEERIRLQLAVKNLNDALAEVGNCHQRQSERDAAKTAFLRDHIAPYYQRTEDMRGHHWATERRLEAVALKLKEVEAEVGQLRQELATARGEADALRDTVAQARGVAVRLGRIESEVQRVNETWDQAVARRDKMHRARNAEQNKRADDAARRLREERAQDTLTLRRIRDERATARRERNQARNEAKRLREELEKTRFELSGQDAELAELARAARTATSFTFGAASASGSTVASHLAEIPDGVRSKRCPRAQTDEEMAALGQAAR
ncbi:hypothetical protein BAE44_0015113, partial [Dichanthelium oligosanthes]